MIEQASTGKMPAKAFPELGLNMVHVDDVADGILLAYDKGQVGESYVLGGEITTQGELIDKAAAIGGEKPPRMTVPPADAEGDDPGRAAASARRWASRPTSAS